MREKVVRLFSTAALVLAFAWPLVALAGAVMWPIQFRSVTGLVTAKAAYVFAFVFFVLVLSAGGAVTAALGLLLAAPPRPRRDRYVFLMHLVPVVVFVVLLVFTYIRTRGG